MPWQINRVIRHADESETLDPIREVGSLAVALEFMATQGVRYWDVADPHVETMVLEAEHEKRVYEIVNMGG
jgi:hypothetical protein